MKHYVTRHGQVISPEDRKFTNHLYPPGDIILSELGEEQARLLGVRMRELGFSGRIIASPYRRTLRTAELIARETGSVIVPYAPIREVFKTEESAQKFRGMTMEEIRKMFGHIDEQATLDDLWWCGDDGTAHAESSDDVRARVAVGYEKICEKYPDTDLLFVGHGASVGGLFRAIPVTRQKKVYTMSYNCSITMVDTETKKTELYCDTLHLDYSITTSNFKKREEFDEEFVANEYDGDIVIPEGVENIKGQKVLHIGDTFFCDYPYYRKLISVLKPDVIIHTGDMADEVKVGRIPCTRNEYIFKIKKLLDILNNSGARLIIVPGNNDLPDKIKELSPKAEVYTRDSIVTIDGVECRIGHQVSLLTYDRDWAFYGHGLTGEEWKYEYNEEGKPCRFNAIWGSFIYSLSENKFFRIPRP